MNKSTDFLDIYSIGSTEFLSTEAHKEHQLYEVAFTLGNLAVYLDTNDFEQALSSYIELEECLGTHKNKDDLLNAIRNNIKGYIVLRWCERTEVTNGE